MDLAAEPFPEPPPRFRHHVAILMTLAMINLLLSYVIWRYVPNEPGHIPLIGWLFDGLRDALLTFVWSVFGIFAAASTAVLAIVPARWNSVGRLVLAYGVGVVALGAAAWLAIQARR